MIIQCAKQAFFLLKAEEWGLYNYLTGFLELEMFAILNSWRWNIVWFKVRNCVGCFCSESASVYLAAFGVTADNEREGFEAMGLSKCSGLRGEVFHISPFHVIFHILFSSSAISHVRWAFCYKLLVDNRRNLHYIWSLKEMCDFFIFKIEIFHKKHNKFGGVEGQEGGLRGSGLSSSFPLRKRRLS